MKKGTVSQEDLDKITGEALDWKNKYVRALADYQNLEKRMVLDRLEQARIVSTKVLSEFLAVFDTLQKAEEHVKDEGLSLGMKSLWAVFEKNGVAKIDVNGKKFDPMQMECVEVVPADEDDVVVQELQPGYVLYGKVIRVAKVTVGKKTDKTPKQEAPISGQN